MSAGLTKLSSVRRPRTKSRLWFAALIVCLCLGSYFLYPHVRAEIYYRAALRDLEARNYPEARAEIDVCLRTWPKSAATQFVIARLARQAGFHEEADRRLSNCERLNGPIEKIRLERLLLQAQQGGLTQHTEALLVRYVEQDHHPDAAAILEALSQGCIRVFRNDSAVKYLDQLQKMRPIDTHVLLMRGLVHDRMYNWEAAHDDYATVLNIEPGNNEALLRLAQSLAEMGKPQEALARFEELLKRDPDQTIASFGLAQQLAKLGRFDEAQKRLDDLAVKWPKRLVVNLARGQMELNRGNPATAERWLRRALEADPYDAQANDALYRCLQALNKKKEAEEQLKRNENIRKDLERLNDLNEQLQANPYESGLPLRVEIAEIYFRMGQDREAIIRLEGALQLDPNYRPSLEALANYYEKKGLTERAREYRQRIAQAGK